MTMQQAKHTLSRQHPRSAVAASHTRAKPAADFTDNRPAAIAQRKLAEAIESSPRAVAQRALMSAMQDSSYGAVQRRRLGGMFGATTQLAGGQEEELLQGKFSPVQRQGAEEEEMVQGKFAPVQREGGMEEEELLQGKFSPVQRQEPEEEKMLQGKFAPVQRVGGPEEEDLLQGKFSPVQRQGPEEEELLQGKFAPVQRVDEQEEEPLQGKFAPVQRAAADSDREPRENNTGLPDNLKSGIESLSGMSLDHVKVHYNSAEPAQLNALAYAQGSDIHVAPGQEQHLPHEAWHVVQQAQGRVKPTMQMKDGVPVNDDAGLEREADVMGSKAVQMHRAIPRIAWKPSTRSSALQLAGLNSSSRVVQMDGYAYGGKNTTPHVHTYGVDSHLQIFHRGRVRRYNIVQNGVVHGQATDALDAAQGNAVLVGVIQGLINAAR